MSSIPDFRLTWLWRHAFVNPQPDVTTAEQEFFRERYLAMREKVGMLVSRIATDMPGLTVHDLSHLDALWEMASLVAEGAVSVNPAKAFVFGASVLLHDAAMSAAAFPNGLTDIKQSLTWKDTVASLLQGSSDAPSMLNDPPIEIIQRAVPEVLRRLHAQQAAMLAEQGWVIKNGDTVYLIEDEELRFFYGQTIGQVACSHWWPVARVELELQEDLGALPQRTRSRIDRVKLACLLRVADALHLDQRRAPRFLRALVQPQGVSALHWAFQERLAAPHVELDAIVFTAGSPFSLADADAWWLAYDTMAAVDRELRDVDLLMQNRGRGILRARRVKGAGTPESLARTIQTRGWRPVDTQLRVSDIPKIVEILGGAKLYGDDPTVALRELIQNSADAVQARRRYQERTEEAWGLIKVALSTQEDGYWLSVEDNGIGMSEQVLTGPLIDFGNSFWRSPLATEEFPGLVASGMAAIGRYGIGFFSVFMLGSVVRVISRRCDRGEDTARVLEFRDGTASRPILRPAAARQAPVDGGTRIEIKLKTDPRGPNGLLHVNQYNKSTFTLQQLVAAMAPNIDVAIETIYDGKCSTALRPGDWLDLDDESLLTRLDPIFQRSASSSRTPSRSLMRTISNAAGKVFGRAFIWPELYSFSRNGGWVTVGGLRTNRLANVQGVLLGEVLTAARDSAMPIVSRELLADWATEQARLIAALSIDEEQKAKSAEVVLECCGQTNDLPIARWGEEWINAEGFRDRIATLDEVTISFDGEFRYDEDHDEVHPRDFRDNFKVARNIIMVPNHDGAILSVARQSWPNSITDQPKWSDSNLGAEIRRILAEDWGDDINQKTEEREIGTVGYASISRDVDIFARGGSDVEV